MGDHDIVITRPSKGTPNILFRDVGDAQADIFAALKLHGWERIDRVAEKLRKQGYHVTMRDFTKKRDK